jgi:hypothetical protein
MLFVMLNQLNTDEASGCRVEIHILKLYFILMPEVLCFLLGMLIVRLLKEQ